MNLVRNHRCLSSLASLFALTAVLLRVLLPAGFMMAPSGNALAGAIPIVLCTGKGNVEAWLGADGTIIDQTEASTDQRPDHAPGDDGKHGDCVFAHAATAIAPGSIATVVQPVSHYQERPSEQVRDLVPGRGLAAPPPPATAPPILI